MATDFEDKTKTLLAIVADYIPPTAVAAIAAVFEGPAAGAAVAAGGVFMTRSAKALVSEFANRHLSSREEARVGAVAVLAIRGYGQRLEQGQTPRDDDFFSKPSTGRAKAEEIFEGVLQKSKHEFEERKTAYYANIFINAVFDESFTPDTLNHMLALGERLTFRQLCLLQLFSRPQPFQLRDHDYHSGGPPHRDPETINVLSEVFDLCQQSLVRCYKPGSKSARERVPILGISDIRPSWMVRVQFGDRLHTLMELNTLPNDELAPVATTLK